MVLSKSKLNIKVILCALLTVFVIVYTFRDSFNLPVETVPLPKYFESKIEWKGIVQIYQATEKTPLMKTDFHSFSLLKLEDLYFTEIKRTHIPCENEVRIGGANDGGWDVCLDKGFEVLTPCLVYSFGISNNWNFDEQMSKSYKCTIRSFDPTIGKPDHIHQPGNVNFYAVGIGGHEDGRLGTFRTQDLLTLLRRFKEETTTIDILKMDVEFSEWESLEKMFKSEVLTRVKQLMMEFHTHRIFADYRRYLTVMKQLENLGFRKYKSHRNNACVGWIKSLWMGEAAIIKDPSIRSYCNEVYYVNMRYKK